MRSDFLQSLAKWVGIAALLSLPAALFAGNIYKYQDENGIWHFTDRAPDDEDIQFEAVFMETEPEARVKMRQQGDKRNPIYLVYNDYHGPVEIELKLVEAVNVITEPVFPARMVIPGQKERVVAGIAALEERMGFQFKLSMSTVPGRPIPTPVKDLVILPPIAPGEAYPISQGFNGNTTHASADAQYAIDIVMPVGTPVHAARAGRVMDVEEDFNRGGTNMDKFGHKANYVRILHDDGTMAQYAHLDLASVTVRPGSRVRAGQMIARSGNTGFSSGPHLHFAIQQNTGMKLISLPYRFRSPDGQPRQPQKSTLLHGFSPQ